MRHEDKLSGITCWLGHSQDQEQWIRRRVTLEDGGDGIEYETRCDCGESIRVTFDADGRVVEEVQG